MKRGERGFTLVEVLVSVAIMSAIVGGVAMTTRALLTNPQRSTSQNVVLHQVQNAGYWISHDVQAAKNVTFDDPSGFPLSLDVPIDTDGNNNQTIDYLFDGNKLKRQVYDSSATLISETLIAQYIDVENTTFSISILDPNTFELTVKASNGEAATERSYRITQRIGST